MGFLERRPDDIVLLVEPQYATRADERTAEILAEVPFFNPFGDDDEDRPVLH